MVGLGILTVSLFIALMFASYKYEQLEADNELYDNLLEGYNDREDEVEARIIDLQETIDNVTEGSMRLVIENMELQEKNNKLVESSMGLLIEHIEIKETIDILNNIIDMLAEAEVAWNFPEEVNE